MEKFVHAIRALIFGKPANPWEKVDAYVFAELDRARAEEECRYV